MFSLRADAYLSLSKLVQHDFARVKRPPHRRTTVKAVIQISPRRIFGMGSRFRGNVLYSDFRHGPPRAGRAVR